MLSDKGLCYVYPISEREVANPAIDKVFQKLPIDANIDIKERKLIQGLGNLKMIATGDDHFLGLTNNGEVYAMGDDTFGQCGVSDTN